MPQQMRCAVLGSPIAHSLSPILHKAAYEELQLDWHYDRFDVNESQLDDFLVTHSEGWAGLSCTMPLKRALLNYGKPKDHWSYALGVANTVVIRPNEALSLYNTDVAGVCHAFARKGVALQDLREVLMIGNGNTACSILAALTVVAPQAHVVAVSIDESLNPPLQALANQHAIRLDVDHLNNYHNYIRQADLVVSALPPHAADSVAAKLREIVAHDASLLHAALFNVAYDPRPTALCALWQDAGLLAIDGLWMLVYQAIEQVRLMTDGYATQPWSETTFTRVEGAMLRALQSHGITM